MSKHCSTKIMFVHVACWEATEGVRTRTNYTTTVVEQLAVVVLLAYNITAARERERGDSTDYLLILSLSYDFL